MEATSRPLLRSEIRSSDLTSVQKIPYKNEDCQSQSISLPPYLISEWNVPPCPYFQKFSLCRFQFPPKKVARAALENRNRKAFFRPCQKIQIARPISRRKLQSLNCRLAACGKLKFTGGRGRALQEGFDHENLPQRAPLSSRTLFSFFLNFFIIIFTLFRCFLLLAADGERLDQQRLPVLPASTGGLHFAQLLHRPHRRNQGRGGRYRICARGVPRDGATASAALPGCNGRSVEACQRLVQYFFI